MQVQAGGKMDGDTELEMEERSSSPSPTKENLVTSEDVPKVTVPRQE